MKDKTYIILEQDETGRIFCNERKGSELEMFFKGRVNATNIVTLSITLKP